MSVSESLQTGAEQLEGLIFFTTVDLPEGHIQLECNACSTDDFVFYSGDGDDLTTSGWIVKAVTHGFAYHKTRMTT